MDPARRDHGPAIRDLFLGCGQAANWTKVTVDEGPDSMVAADYYLGTSIAIGRDGRRHISYFNGAGSDLRYATCSSGCAQAANWEKVTVDEGSAVRWASTARSR